MKGSQTEWGPGPKLGKRDVGTVQKVLQISKTSDTKKKNGGGAGGPKGKRGSNETKTRTMRVVSEGGWVGRGEKHTVEKNSTTLGVCKHARSEK